MNYTVNEKFHIPELLNTNILNIGTQEKTVITREYPAAWKVGMEPYYPVNDERNSALYRKYKELADKKESHIIFGGSLGHYKYYDMDHVIEQALNTVKKELKEV